MIAPDEPVSPAACAQGDLRPTPPVSPDAPAVAVVLTTLPTADAAAELARSLVADHVAACVQVVPGIRSIYRWKGEVCDEAEVLLVIKTAGERVATLIEVVKARHPYETPEILALPVAAGSPPYLQWVVDSTRA